MRDAFEKWAHARLRAEGYGESLIQSMFLDMDHDGSYRDRSVKDTHDAWQAARADALEEAAIACDERHDFHRRVAEGTTGPTCDAASQARVEARLCAGKIRALKESV